MRVTENDIKAAVKAKLLTQKQADQLIDFWQQRKDDVPTFRLTHILYYFGGLLTISAITLFLTQAWNLLLGIPLFVLSSLFFILGLLLMHYLLNQRLRLPAGIMATFSLVAVPLAIYNLQIWLGYFPKINTHYADYHYFLNWIWVPMELGTLLAGVIMFYFYRFPFLLFPISITLWYMSMDLYALFYNMNIYNWQARSFFSMCFGLLMLLYAFYVDIKYNDENNDYAFWLYLFGMMTFWGGLSSQFSHSELQHFIYCMINIVLILLSVFLNRRVFAVFGAMGVLGYVGYLAFNVFANSLGFPIVMVFLGILIILATTRWARVEKKIFAYFKPYIPATILARREKL